MTDRVDDVMRLCLEIAQKEDEITPFVKGLVLQELGTDARGTPFGRIGLLFGKSSHSNLGEDASFHLL